MSMKTQLRHYKIERNEKTKRYRILFKGRPVLRMDVELYGDWEEARWRFKWDAKVVIRGLIHERRKKARVARKRSNYNYHNSLADDWKCVCYCE